MGAAPPAAAPPAVQRPQLRRQLLHQLCNASFLCRSVLKVESPEILPKLGLWVHTKLSQWLYDLCQSFPGNG
ncbi:hypothetical protein AXF42_Ash021616 [Apostasia shenzhenica]|uniref:Uncharacterized protein n=1 Tax=Apostasia shenzhenica TaxID=1088818 RepID=A0A2H9ZUE1_9ASPA|nr:hypothetical protein AXF42_Ash021616 [Apostasia shenzhenica]